MGKKIRYQLLKGSFIEPMFQFTNKVEIGINPVNDPKGTRIGTSLHNLAKSIKPKFKGENFETTLDYDLTSSSSYVIFHYCKICDNKFSKRMEARFPPEKRKHGYGKL